MITRPAMVNGGALALAGSRPFLRAASAAGKTAPGAGAAGGRLRYRDARGLARQEAADQAVLSSAQLRDAALAFRLRIHAERLLLRALPSLHSGRDRRGGMEAQSGRRRYRQAA